LETPRRRIEARGPEPGAPEPPPVPDSEYRRRTIKRRDRVLGVVLGVLLGLAIVILFVFFGSQETIDAPSIDDNPPAERRAEPSDRR
jgi:hypothetical protein